MSHTSPFWSGDPKPRVLPLYLLTKSKAPNNPLDKTPVITVMNYTLAWTHKTKIQTLWQRNSTVFCCNLTSIASTIGAICEFSNPNMHAHMHCQIPLLKLWKESSILINCGIFDFNMDNIVVSSQVIWCHHG